MNYFAFSGLINGLVSTVCGATVYFQNRNSRKNQIYALYCLSAAVWSFFYCAWNLATDHATALLYARGVMMGAIFIPTLYYHHILTLFNLETPKNKKWLTFFYAMTIIFALTNFTPYFTAGIEQRLFFPYWIVPGPLFHLYFSLFFFQVMLANFILWKESKKMSSIARNQVGWITLATIIGWICGLSNFLLFYHIPIAPYANIGVSIYVGISALLFFRLGLLDIRQVLKHVSIVLLIYGLLLAVILPTTIPLTNHLLRTQTMHQWQILLLFGLIVGLTLSTGPFIYAYLVRNKTWLRGQLTTGLTHELKSPLSNIQSAISVALENIQTDGDKSMTVEYLGMIESNATRLEKYVKDLLQVAKLHDGEIQITKAPLSMERIILDVVETYRPLAENKGLQIQSDVKPCDDIHADYDKVNLVLSNLLANAIKFSDSGSITIALNQNGTSISCHVNDQGCGISEKDLGKVFDRFFQGANSAKGSGIGLAIAKGWVEAHGGEIHAESDGPGKGSRFWFTLPK